MKNQQGVPRSSIIIQLCIALALVFASSASAQFAPVIVAGGTTPDARPRQGIAFWSLQLPLYPPLPFCPFRGLPIEEVSPGQFVYDDRSVDYEVLWEERARQAAEFAALQAMLGFPSDAKEDGGTSQMRAGFNNNSIYGGLAVYLTNLVATPSGTNVAATFTIAGGTNFVPYDISTTTNLTNNAAQWAWLGLGYTAHSYTFSNQPLDQAFYILARPEKTMVAGWGNNLDGQCDVPFGLSNAVAVAAGWGQSLALASDGTVVAWGTNDHGQGSVPTNLAGVTMIAAGWFHDVALMSNGTVTAWGANSPEIGWTLTNVPPDLTNAAVISAHALHSLALTSNGLVVAWGYGPSGETNVPSDLSNVVAIAAGLQFNLAAKADGSVSAWGINNCGQCNVPAGLSNVVDVAAGPYHCLALRSNGTVFAWGDGSHGETNVPGGLTNIVAIAAGGDPYHDSAYSLALKSDGSVVAWGKSEALGPVAGLSNVCMIAAGVNHALAVRTGPRAPVITLQPTNRYQIAGGSVTFTARGTGLYAVGYQWQTNGVNLPGATNAALTLTNVQASHEATYNVVVSNEVGTIASTNATFTLVTPPAIISQAPMPTNQVAIYHQNLSLIVSASAPGQANGFPLSYQWKLNGTNISGATASSYTVLGDTTTAGHYTVTVTNTAGSVTVGWLVSMTYAGSYIDTNTLCYHLSTNATARTNGFADIYNATVVLTNWTYATYTNGNLGLLTNAIWSTNSWINGVQGLSATCIGFSNGLGGTLRLTMISPRHYVRARHVGIPNGLIAFLDTNNVLHWRASLQQVNVGDDDTSVGIVDSDLPASVGFMPIAPTNLLSYMPTNNTSYVQGLGMNQDMRLVSQPMVFGSFFSWDYTNMKQAPFGLTTNWSVAMRSGDSSNPKLLLINKQLVLLSHNYAANIGPNYGTQFYFNTINQKMHYLSTNNGLPTDYQLTPFALTNWPAIH